MKIRLIYLFNYQFMLQGRQLFNHLEVGQE
jgi:hypothetical protein